jgi:WD40 repeat protein
MQRARCIRRTAAAIAGVAFTIAPAAHDVRALGQEKTPHSAGEAALANGPRRCWTPAACHAVRLQGTITDMDRAVVTAISAAPTGDRLAVAGDDYAIRIFDASNLRIRTTLRGHRDLIRTVAFAPDGRRLASAGNDGQLIIWECADSIRMVQRIEGTPALRCVRFSPRGDEVAAVGFDRSVYLIGKRASETRKLLCECGDLRAVSYREDGERLVAAGRSGKLYVFDPRSGRLLAEQSLHLGRIHDLAFQPASDSVVSVGEDGDVVVFDTQREREESRCHVAKAKLFSVAAIDGRHVAVAGSDNVIRIIDTIEPTIAGHLEGHIGSVPSLCFCGGRLFSGGFDATLRRWSIPNDKSDEERIAEVDSPIDR